MDVVTPAIEHLSSYAKALERDWSPDTGRPAAARDERDRIAVDPTAFLAELTDPDGHAPPVVLPDGSVVPRLPSYRWWLWDGEFAGSVALRWQPGTTALPPYCLGHIGYSVVPWRRRRGYATYALGQILPRAAHITRLPFVELTTNADNLASRRVIERNGGELVEHFVKPPSHGGGDALRFRIQLSAWLPLMGSPCN